MQQYAQLIQLTSDLLFTSPLRSIDLTSSTSLALWLKASDEGALALLPFAMELLMPFPALEWELATSVNAVELLLD